jgi:putative SOS response-associated peptidase YedK
MSRLAEFAGISGEIGELAASYNVCPGDPIVNLQEWRGARRLETYTWGLVPHWSKDPSRKHINARAEGVAGSPPFRDAFVRGRSIILADGFYEWDEHKQPYYVRLKDRAPLALAGICDRWVGDSQEILSCAVITTTPNDRMAAVHNRMPAILHPKHWDEWLDLNGANKERLRFLLRPYPPEELELFPVSKAVSNPRNNAPDLIRPLP